MKYKKYGKTGKEVSVIGFGGMRFPNKDSIYDEEYCINMVHEASRLGVNYFDTAPGYNDDKSEILFGKALKSMPNDFYVSTKSAERNGDKLRASLEKSLKRLNVDKINFFHIWCILTMDDFESRMVKNGAYEAVIKAKEEGLIEHVCFSTHCTGKDIATICDKQLFEGVTLGYNIINSVYRQEGIKGAYRNNMGVVTMNPLGGGLIPRNKEYFSYIKDENDKNVIEAAIKFNTSHKEITVALTGMDSIEHIKQNAISGNEVRLFNEKHYEIIKTHSDKSMDQLCTGCQYCEPCPSNIEISKFLLSYNRKILGDETDMKQALKYHWRIPVEQLSDCTECGLCETRCTQHLPIIERINEMKELYNL